MTTQLEEQLKQTLREGQYSLDTERAYLGWYGRFTRYHQGRSPQEMGANDVEDFLRNLSLTRKVAPSTQNQAINAITFLYKNVIKRDIGPLDTMRAVRPPRLPEILTNEEVRTLLSGLRGTAAVQAGLLYGCGLRIKECLRLRVRDLNLASSQITIHDRDGERDRTLTLPDRLKPMIEGQLQYAHTLFNADCSSGLICSDSKWENYWVFPADSLSVDPKTRQNYRHHSVDVTLSRAIARSAKLACIRKKVTAQTFRHSFATHLLMRGVDIKAVQDALGHANVQTTEIYTQILKAAQSTVRSPLDDL